MVGAPLREVGAPMSPGESPAEGKMITSGEAVSWGQQPGGATQLQVIKDNGKAASITDLLKEGILKGKQSSGGLHG